MALNYEQVRLIKATVPLIRQDGERIAALFYHNMIRDNPAIHAWFNPVSMHRGQQPKAFTMMMLAFASSINDISGLVSRMEKVAQKHASLGITPDLYDFVGEYLLGAFAEVLGPHCWDKATREAWERAYAVMAGMLTRREALIYRDFGSWVGWRRFVVSQRWTELADGNDGEGDIVTIEVRAEDGKKLPQSQPGQYISLRLSGVPSREHPQLRQYFLCGDPTSTSVYRFSVRRDASRETVHIKANEPSYIPRSSSSSTAATAPIAPSPRVRASSPDVFQRRLRGCSASSRTDSASSSRPGTPSSADSSLNSSHARTSSMSRVRPGVVSSMLIDQVMVGDVLELTHPAGEFILEQSASDGSSTAPIVLISAGIGAAPLLSMLKALLPTAIPPSPSVPTAQSRHPLQQHPLTSQPSVSSLSASSRQPPQTGSEPSQPRVSERPISWVHGSRYRPLYGDTVRDLAKKFPKRLSTAFFRTRLADSEVLTYTLDFAADLNLGRVKPFEDLHIGYGQQAEYYVCGPHRFMVEVKKYLEANRVDPSKVKYGLLEIGAMDKDKKI